jgi:hypothetical protein
MESSGRRRPIGESPGISQRVSSSRRNQAPDIQPSWGRSNTLDGQRVADHFTQALLEKARNAVAFQLVLQIGFLGVTFDGKRRSFQV